MYALTVIHNELLRRDDGTTAAERFTGQKHADLFAHLVAINAAARTAARPEAQRGAHHARRRVTRPRVEVMREARS